MAATNPKVVHLFDDDGTPTPYLKVSARIPEFLKEYGPDKGYRVLSEISDWNDVTDNRMTLIMALVEKGQLSNDRIDELLNDRKFVFRSKLIDEQGNVIAEATAVKRIWREKEVETGETAAFQRLMARLGFGGEIFDVDEVNDFESQNLNYQTSGPVDNSPVTAAPVSDDNQEQVQPEPEPESKKDAESKLPVEPEKPKSKAKPSPAKDKSKQGEGKRAQVSKVQPAQLKMLASQARIKGVDCPTVETIEEFQLELARIRALPLPE